VKDSKKTKNLPSQEPKTTGHEWDGITEYDNPDPFWLRLMFYCALFFALAYWLLYPSWPSQRSQGVLGWSEYTELEKSLSEVRKKRNEYLVEFDKASFEEIMKDKKLLKFAITGGKSIFQNNCSPCHGTGGRGNPNYPNLTTGAWLWGGKIEDIYQTIKFGIRSEQEETRLSQMAAFGRDKILSQEDIKTLVDFVVNLPKGIITSDAANQLFQHNCASCHGVHGEGNREVGAPALNTAIRQYGHSPEQVYDVIQNGRQGVMPYWIHKLDDASIRQVAIYVHQLGGGE
jgi:cytochrome c oxidase cbb3-type subunit 3